jgi:ATP-dependent Lon protease
MSEDGEALDELQDVIELPLVPLRDNVIFPNQIAPLAAGRPRSVAALETAVNGDSRVVLAVQRDASAENVGVEDLWEVAVIASVGAFRRFGQGGAHALVEGQTRVRIKSMTRGEMWSAKVVEIDLGEVDESAESAAKVSSLKESYAGYVAAGAAVGPDVAVQMARSLSPDVVTDIASAAPDLTLEDRVGLLQEVSVSNRLDMLLHSFARLVEVAQLRARIHEDVQKSINNTQREHILREQLRLVRKELSELDGSGEDTEESLVDRVEALALPEAARERVLKEVRRLEMIPSASPEMGMVRTWVDWILELPWGEPDPEQVDIERAGEILDEDHYGLRKVKDRILEWLAVRQRIEMHVNAAKQKEKELESSAEEVKAKSKPDRKGYRGRDKRVLQTPILCLVGPPGVGKTSLGRSVARALDRPFVRMSLGGIRDEAEIRGHRRTYIGALPGRIIQSMRQAGASNPVIMLDEIDKVGTDFRGDPSSALLEVLDPEQNWEFSDHYLEVPFDLSHVLFITTANVEETISPPLRDRMEIIRISGYTETEKAGIAERHLVPKQREQHALETKELTISADTITEIVRGYTREAGVRQLDRNLAEIARKIPRKLATTKVKRVKVDPKDLSEYLGPKRFDHGEMQERDEIGAVTGVVVSDVGGDIVTVEALAIEGRGELTLTGQLGSVMDESARAALSWAKVHAQEYGARKDFFDMHTVHIHVPAGAIPKDGPSAGVTMTTALVSVASGRPVRRDVAMTGEVTLRGNVLPIGGLKDKLLAAHRAGMTKFILPKVNMRDLKDIEPEIKDNIEIVAVDNVGEVLDVALLTADAPVRPRTMGFIQPPIDLPSTLH